MDQIFKLLNECIDYANIGDNVVLQKKLIKARDLLIRKLEIEYEEFGGQL